MLPDPKGTKQPSRTRLLSLEFNTFQAYQVTYQIRQLTLSQLVLIRGHGRFFEDAGFFQVRAPERYQASGRIEHLHGVLVFVEERAGDGRAFFRHSAESPVLRENFRIGIRDRTLEFAGQPQITDVAQIGAGTRALAPDAVATCAT